MSPLDRFAEVDGLEPEITVEPADIDQTVRGRPTSGSDGRPRIARVKHYNRGWRLDLSIGLAGRQRALAAIALDIDNARQLAAALLDAADQAERCMPAETRDGRQ